MKSSRRRSRSWRRDFVKTDTGQRRASRLRVLRRKHGRMAQALEAVTAAERKRDAHEKIQLGGVVVKAGLRTIDKAVLLGALMQRVRALRRQSATTAPPDSHSPSAPNNPRSESSSDSTAANANLPA